MSTPPPPSADARFEAARNLHREGRAVEALSGLDQLLADAPDHLPSLVMRGSVLLALDRPEDAERHWRRALSAFPDQEVLVSNLGALLRELERPDEALALADDTLSRKPGLAHVAMLRADALAALGRFEEAAEAYRAVPRAPGLAIDASTKEAQSLAALGRRDAALKLLDRAIAEAPANVHAPFRRALVRLGFGDFGGWTDYEARWRVPNMVERLGRIVTHRIVPQLTQKPTPSDLAGRRILLLGEQGIGDQVMFASMIPDLAGVARSVTCVCDPRLVSLFAASMPQIAFASPANARISGDSIDRVVAMGSLGHAFRPTPEAFPGAPYLTPRPEVRAKWAGRLGPKARPLRIGLAWRGGTALTRRSFRSLSLAQLQPVLDLPGCEFVSLQHGDVAAELAASPSIRSFAADDLKDFEDLAGLVAELDLVVSVQTSLVHLCGALGQTCLTLVPRNAEWRYGASGAVMPWYRSVRIHRQPESGDWKPVIEEVATAVRDRLSATR